MNKTLKKTLSIILTVLMIVTTVPLAFAAADVTATIDTGENITLQDADNDGYYDIGTADELYAFAVAVNGGNGSINGELTADVVVNENVLDENGELNGDISKFRVWTPIGLYVDSYDAATVFHGKFNGNNHTVSGLYFNYENHARVGLFGCTNGASIQNVGVLDCYIKGYQYVGGVVGFLRSGTLRNCYNTGGVLGNNTLGGVAGWAGKSSTIQNCFNTGNVISEKGTTGGVVGYIYDTSNTTTLENCYNTGNVVGLIASYARPNTGGVIGSVGNNTVENCFFLENTVTIEGKVSNGSVKTGTQAMSFAQFASGEVAHRLGSAFGQILTGDNRQSYPVLGGTQVNYGFTTCDEAQTTEIYTNEEAFNTKPAHSGGTATCVAKAVCETCGVEYGDIDEDNHKDTLVQVDAKAKTCTEIGWDAYEYCTACDYSTYVEIPVSHEIKTVDKKDATCTEAGYEAYEYCTECDYTTYKEIPATDHDWIRNILVRPKKNTGGTWLDGYYYDKCKNDESHNVVTGVAKRADYTAYDNACAKLSEYLSSVELTDAAVAEIQKSLAMTTMVPDNLVEGESSLAFMNNWVKSAETIIAKIESGEYVKVDGLAVLEERVTEWEIKFEEDGVFEKAAEIANNLTEEAAAKLQEIYNFACSLNGSVTENAENIAKIESDVDEFFGQIENCIYDIHNGLVYGVIEEAECEKNAVEAATCTFCGAIVEREVSDSALTHKDDDGDYICDHGCGHEFEKPVEPTPDTPDTPDEPADDTCDHLCHKSGFMGFIWKIFNFFFRLFNIQQYCDCGVIHYDAPVFG